MPRHNRPLRLTLQLIDSKRRAAHHLQRRRGRHRQGDPAKKSWADVDLDKNGSLSRERLPCRP
jgi:hypothetical protein